MARHAPLTPYVAPITTAGAAVTMTDAGNATLSSGTTYYYLLGNPSQKLLNEVSQRRWSSCRSSGTRMRS